MAGVELTLLARNNEILGTATTDADGRATFTPGLTRGTGGMVPAVLTASQGDSDFVFLDMTRAGFDLSDRGVTGRAAPGALDVYAWTERGIYRAGETVHVAALARDDAGQGGREPAADLHLHAPRRRRGPPHRQRRRRGRRLRGRPAAARPTPCAAPGRCAIYTDPKQPAVASQMFLVEDFVPDRIEFDLASDTRRDRRSAKPANVTVDGRFLYGAPAAGLALEGEVTVVDRRANGSDFPGYPVRPRRRAGRRRDAHSADGPAARSTRTARRPSRSRSTQLPSTTQLLNADVTVRMRESGGRAVERSLDLPSARKAT